MNEARERCPLCGCAKSKFVFRERGFALRSCDECELFYVQPYPQQAVETYDRVAHYQYEELKILDIGRHYQSSILYYNDYFPKLKGELDGAKRVLDIGCGTGRLLELLGQEFNLERMGIELNVDRAAHARKVAKCSVLEIPVEEFSTDQSFDVIFMMNVLSHISHLDPFFTAVRRLLAHDGRLVMKVGEMSRTMKKHAIHDWGIPDHLHFLGLRTVDVLANKYRFQISRHDRWRLSVELFAKSTWKAPGRSRVRNAIKRTVASLPGALPILAKTYDMLHGQNIFTSLIVLRKDGS